MPGNQVFPGMILTVDDLAGYRIPVLMDIGRTHKDGYLYPPGVKIFRIRYLFDHHYFSIGRADDKIGPDRPLADRHAKERYQEQEDSQGYQEDQTAHPE